MDFEFIENEEIVVYGTAQDIANGIMFGAFVLGALGIC